MFLITVIYLFVVAGILKVIQYFSNFSRSKPVVQVVVLGDIGHSPRMQYHALSLANTGKFFVELIGYRGSAPLDAILGHESITVCYMYQFSIPSRWKVPFFVYGLLKVLFDSTQLFLFLLTRRSRYLLVQTPPAVPSVLVCVLIQLITRTKLVLDFHNITFMHLSWKLDNSKRLNRIIIWGVKKYEIFLSRFSHWNFCVTNSMKDYLQSTDFQLGNHVTTLYDRPGPQFVGRVEKSDYLEQKFRNLTHFGVNGRKSLCEYDSILISTTSWTDDELFSILLEALPALSAAVPISVLILITGKGAGKKQFEKEFQKLRLPNIDLCTGWVDACDYPLFLGIADVGMSFHSSTSGLDLPMKIVDMLGAELPIVAYSFSALFELTSEVNALEFQTAEELCECLYRLTVQGTELRNKGHNLARKWRKFDWNSQWTQKALEVFS